MVLADLNGDAAQAAATQLTDDGYDAIGVDVDITSSESAAAMAAATVDRFGGIDILVNNAALRSELQRTRLVDLPTDWFERVMRMSVMGAVVCARVVLDSMVERGGRRIVNQSSAGGFSAVASTASARTRSTTSRPDSRRSFGRSAST